MSWLRIINHHRHKVSPPIYIPLPNSKSVMPSKQEPISPANKVHEVFRGIWLAVLTTSSGQARLHPWMFIFGSFQTTNLYPCPDPRKGHEVIPTAGGGFSQSENTAIHPWLYGGCWWVQWEAPFPHLLQKSSTSPCQHHHNANGKQQTLEGWTSGNACWKSIW